MTTQQPAPASPKTNASMGGHVIALIGGILVAISPLLPWMTAGALSVSGAQKTNNEALLLVVLGLWAALSSLIVMVRGDLTVRRGWVYLLMGLLSLLLLIYYYSLLSGQASDLSGGLLNVQIGIGLYLGFIGAGLMVIGSFVAPR